MARKRGGAGAAVAQQPERQEEQVPSPPPVEEKPRKPRTAREEPPKAAGGDLAGWTAIIEQQGKEARAAREPVNAGDWADDINPPDTSKTVVVLSPFLVVERSDDYNWALLHRHQMKDGTKNAGRWRWTNHGYYRSPGGCHKKALDLETQHRPGPGAIPVERYLRELAEVEERLRTELLNAERAEMRRRLEEEKRQVSEAARKAALGEALAAIRNPEDKARVQKLLELPSGGEASR